MSEYSIKMIKGTGIPVRGNDIDTDRIIPARFLKCVTFSELGPESFKDDRFDVKGKSKNHSFDNPAYQGASVLFVNKNFGCGSSREHAPQALNRWGINAIVGETFAEIFFGNCVAMGIPCVAASSEKIGEMMTAIEKNPKAEVIVDVEKLEVKIGSSTFKVELAEGPRGSFLNGSWDATIQLLENEDEVKKVAKDLPYVSSW